MSAASTEHGSSRRLAAARHARPSSRGLCASAALLAFLLAVDVDAVRTTLAASFQPAFAEAAGARTFASLSSTVLPGNGRALVSVLGPLLAAIVAGVLVAGLVQLGASSFGKAARSDRARPAPFDPAARVRELLEPERAIDGLFALFAALVLSCVAWLAIAPSVRGVLALPGADALIVAPQLLELLGVLALRLTLAGLALGALDYLQRRVRHARRVRVTRRELLDDQREQYGDPQLRAERARRMRSLGEDGRGS